MSGVLLAVALYAILRIQTITDAVIGPDFLRIMLSVGGLLSLFVAAALLIRQRDFKRMLAYSSIEHMGMMAVGAAIGPAALPAVLLYVLGHGLTKATLFVISGRILEVEGTPKIDDVRALLVRRPGLAVPWLIAMAALIGFPPFSIFFSEVGIIVAGFSTGLGVVVGIALVLLLVIFASLTRLTVAMTIGAPAATAVPVVPAAAVPAAGAAASVTGAVPVSVPSASVTLADAEPHPDDPLVPDRSGHGPMLPLILALGTTAVVAFIAEPVGTLLTRAAEVLGGIQ
jgi:hydrogenase-4 component F